MNLVWQGSYRCCGPFYVCIYVWMLCRCVYLCVCFLHYLCLRILFRHHETLQVHLGEAEVRSLCIRAREVFMSQPALLEVEAPLKICGGSCELLFLVCCRVYDLKRTHEIWLQGMCMVSTMMCFVYLSMVVSPQSQTTCFWATMWIVESRVWKLYAYYWRSRLNTQRTFSC